VCGSEIWAVAEVDMNSLGTWNGIILRRLLGPAVEQGMWRIRTDQELRELYKDLDTVAGIEKVNQSHYRPGVAQRFPGS